MSLEFTGELTEEGYSVTECVGGSMGLSEEELGLRYQVRGCACVRASTLICGVQSFCDPRLNFEQSLGEWTVQGRRAADDGWADVAFLVCDYLKKGRTTVLYRELGGPM